MNEREIKDEIKRLAPFHHNIELPYGLGTHLPEFGRREVEKTRLANLIKHAWPSMLEVFGGSFEGQRVLDAACSCGGFSVEAVKSGAEFVSGIDITEHYIEQARFIKRALNLENVDFQVKAIDDLEPENVGHFDVTFCFGILYHLENPVLSMRKLSAITRRVMVVDTTVIPTPGSQAPLWHMNFPAAVTPEDPSATTSLWRMDKHACQFTPNTWAVIELLKFLGFSTVTQLDPKELGLEERYYNGRRVTFLAIRE